MPPQYEPLSEKDKDSGQIFKLSFKLFALVTVLLPFAAFLFCILFSLYLHFEESTATHCHVDNFLPSISAAIGGYQPQRYIWRILIALHAAPRFLIGIMYYNYYQHFLGRNARMFHAVLKLTVLFYTLENSFLILLSYVSSLENRPFHEFAFTAFVICFLLYMFLTLGIFKSLNSVEENERYSYKIKKSLMVTNLSALTCALYCFYRHNTFCEPYVYTAFAFFEYIFVLTNMGFHMTAYLDFRNYEFTINPFHSQKLR